MSATRLAVTVTPRAKENSVRLTPRGLLVRVTAPATDDRANMAMRRLVADHFDVAVSRVQIIRGQTARHKLVEIG